MQHTYGARIEPIIVRPIMEEDLELLRNWRNDSDISRYFRRIDYIDSQMQLNWYNSYLEQNGCYYWSILYDERVVGALSLYDFVDRTAEIGRIMIGDLTVRGKGFGYKSLVAVMKIGFDYFDLEEIHLNVHENNESALKLYKGSGFKIIGNHKFNQGGCEYEMSINKKSFIDTNPISTDVITSPRFRSLF